MKHTLTFKDASKETPKPSRSQDLILIDAKGKTYIGFYLGGSFWYRELPEIKIVNVRWWTTTKPIRDDV